jgi:hypothetical protein
MAQSVVPHSCAAALLRSKAGGGRTIGAALLLSCLFLSSARPLLAQASRPASPPAPAAPQAALARHYQDGAQVAYTINCFNQGRAKTTAYEARVEGAVRKDASGAFVEDLAWTDLNVNDEQVRLSAASRAFREPLSLAQGAKLSLPDLCGVQPALLDPISDLLAFYADLKIAMNQHTLTRAGDHAYVPYGTPISWADGKRIILGQDAVDFDVTLKSIDPAAQIATVVIRHVPPAQPRIKLPAPWMSDRVGNSANNWVQVEKTPDGKYIAGVGQETFEVRIRIAVGTGRIVSATLDNPVAVVERACTDAALTACGAPGRYTLGRQITLRAEPAPALAPAQAPAR